MTDSELWAKICPLINGYNEGVFWDFKKTLNDFPSIIKDIMAFANSGSKKDSYLIFGVSEGNDKKIKKIKLSDKDRVRLNTDSNYLYLPNKWDMHGLTLSEIENIKEISASITQKIEKCMLISIPKLEFYPLQINKTRWIYVIIVKHKPGVYLSNQDLYDENTPSSKPIVKQGLLYVRNADTTLGADKNSPTAMEYIRVWKDYFSWLGISDCKNEKGEQ